MTNVNRFGNTNYRDELTDGSFSVLYPLISFFSWVTHLTYKLFRLTNQSNHTQLSEEEIKLLIKMGEEDGILEKEEKERKIDIINL